MQGVCHKIKYIKINLLIVILVRVVELGANCSCKLQVATEDKMIRKEGGGGIY